MNQESISFIIEVNPSWQWKFNVDKLPHTYGYLYVIRGDNAARTSEKWFCEFIIHSGRLSVSTVLRSCFKTKFIRDMTRGWIEGQF